MTTFIVSPLNVDFVAQNFPGHLPGEMVEWGQFYWGQGDMEWGNLIPTTPDIVVPALNVDFVAGDRDE